MNTREQPSGYQGSYLIGFLIIGVTAVRSILFYQDQPNLALIISILIIYTALYTLEPLLSHQFHWFKFFYFPVQTVLVFIFSFLRPLLDFQILLYVPVFIQAFRVFSRRTAIYLSILYLGLIGVAILPNLGLLAGTAFILLGVAVVGFLISYDFLYSRTLADQMESQYLLAELQSSHRKLQEYAVQSEELAALRERNHLARELHDSVSQAIFSIMLTTQTAQLLLERDPERVPEVLIRLQEMTSSALSQLRTLISQLRPPQNS